MVTHNLTTEQLQKLTDAIGNGSDWPKFTDDPKVNYAVDCVVALTALPEEDEPVYDDTYVAEIEAYKALGAKTG